MKLIAGNSNPKLAQSVSSLLNVPLLDAKIKRFPDNEIFVELKELVRGEDVFIIQSTSFPANDSIMELLIIQDALKRASAKRITAVLPYFGYARQDRRGDSRTSISAKVIADIITTTGANRVLTLDLHTEQIQGFFNIPVDNLYSTPIYEKYLHENFSKENTVAVSPDIGGVKRARALAKKFELDLAIVDKRRDAPSKSEVLSIIGDVNKKDCIIIDDIVDSAGTLCNAANALIQKGASSVIAFVTHGVLSQDAIQRIEQSDLLEVVITDSISNTERLQYSSKIKVVSIASLLAEAIRRVDGEKSVSGIFGKNILEGYRNDTNS